MDQPRRRGDEKREKRKTRRQAKRTAGLRSDSRDLLVLSSALYSLRCVFYSVFSLGAASSTSSSAVVFVFLPFFPSLSSLEILHSFLSLQASLSAILLRFFR